MTYVALDAESALKVVNESTNGWISLNLILRIVKNEIEKIFLKFLVEMIHSKLIILSASSNQ